LLLDFNCKRLAKHIWGFDLKKSAPYGVRFSTD